MKDWREHNLTILAQCKPGEIIGYFVDDRLQKKGRVTEVTTPPTGAGTVTKIEWPGGSPDYKEGELRKLPS